MKYTAAALAAIIGYAAAQDTYGPNCPAPGTTGSDGRYSCNPAHTYPDGQQCQEDGGCYYLTQPGPGVTAPAEYPTTTSTATGYAPTSSCPAPGTNGPDGRYSCNPAHQYPEGQICQEDGGCYYLRIPGPGVSTSVPSYPSATPSKGACPAPGSTGPDGRYSCNPAHTYPDGQICQEDGGCYYLRSPGPGVSVSVPSHYTTEVETAYTTYCPSPTTFTHEQKTYTVTKPTTVTLPCEKGCTVTKPVYGPTVSVPPTAPVVTPSKPVAPTTPVYKPTGNGTQTHSIATYTGGAASFATAAPLAMAALGAFFL